MKTPENTSDSWLSHRITDPPRKTLMLLFKKFGAKFTSYFAYNMHLDDLVQDCSISIANALDILQS